MHEGRAPPRRGSSPFTLPLDTGSPAGRFTVGYRVVSADGHPVSPLVWLARIPGSSHREPYARR
ncbi:copper resistance protein CopC [Streptomyces pseudoechinosporeus]